MVKNNEYVNKTNVKLIKVLNKTRVLVECPLCGSVLEGILSALAMKQPAEFNIAKASPKERDSLKVKSFDKWTLENYIAVAYELGYIKEDVKRFSHEVQNFRNYIHPYQQLYQNFTPTIDTALLCAQVVKIAINQIAERGIKL